MDFRRTRRIHPKPDPTTPAPPGLALPCPSILGAVPFPRAPRDRTLDCFVTRFVLVVATLVPCSCGLPSFPASFLLPSASTMSLLSMSIPFRGAKLRGVPVCLSHAPTISASRRLPSQHQPPNMVATASRHVGPSIFLSVWLLYCLSHRVASLSLLSFCFVPVDPTSPAFHPLPRRRPLPSLALDTPSALDAYHRPDLRTPVLRVPSQYYQI
ncbi:hypothetical protein FB451DRAFT_1567576 [Mycena latifolia]|nr:hypothetical protein FB451DRAFT_1567576 [Mycena latifolia]